MNGKSQEDQERNIAKKVSESFKSCYNDIEEHQVHGFYPCKSFKMFRNKFTNSKN